MTRNKLFATLAMGAVVALTALPASARDREGRVNPRESHRLSTSAPARGILPSIKTSGHSDGIVIRQQSAPITPSRPDFMQKAQCSGSCGGIEFTCSGSQVYCEDGGGCVAAGGGVILILECI
jgi:hypothetical protein